MDPIYVVTAAVDGSYIGTVSVSNYAAVARRYADDLNATPRWSDAEVHECFTFEVVDGMLKTWHCETCLVGAE